MILIGGDKFPQSMTDVGELSEDALDYTAAIAVVNLWLPAVTAVAGTTVPFPDEVVYPSDARGYWLTVSNPSPLVVEVDTAAKTLTFLRAGNVVLTWSAENADGTVATYAQVIAVASAK